MIAATVGGVLVVVFIILFIYLRGRMKNRRIPNANYNMPSPTNFLVTSGIYKRDSLFVFFGVCGVFIFS